MNMKMVLNENCNFCFHCGIKVNGKYNPKINSHLEKEMQFVKKNNEDLKEIIQIYKSAQIWFMLRSVYSQDGKLNYPFQSFISDASSNLKNLLGYSDMANMYFSDLIPKAHQCILNTNNFHIRVERADKHVVPKLVMFGKNLYLKHSSGDFVHILGRLEIFFDVLTKLPSFKVFTIEHIVSLKIEEDSIPPLEMPESIFCCSTFNEIPNALKNNCYIPNGNINVFSVQNEVLLKKENAPSEFFKIDLTSTLNKMNTMNSNNDSKIFENTMDVDDFFNDLLK
eukprot:TRINITY_DN1358_c0_g1_i2.p1 TRINITY_DN1358_c0_g1~~TRINITY_DN1358_c0_g1_i2.p1  ORF type:complete len:281 (-),score=62.97 TRINITY_DN1358_c0_g1_i2:153-995(-)